MSIGFTALARVAFALGMSGFLIGGTNLTLAQYNEPGPIPQQDEPEIRVYGPAANRNAQTCTNRNGQLEGEGCRRTGRGATNLGDGTKKDDEQIISDH